VEVATIRDDAFDALKALQEQGARYDVVIVDPPAFAKRKKDVPQATAAYRKLNQLALPLIDAMACSCPAPARTTCPRTICRGHPGRRAHTSRSCRSWSRAAIAGSPGASGNSRNALPESLFLPRHAGMN
jgi:hypothetical protein